MDPLCQDHDYVRLRQIEIAKGHSGPDSVNGVNGPDSALVVLSFDHHVRSGVRLHTGDDPKGQGRFEHNAPPVSVANPKTVAPRSINEVLPI